MNYLTNFLILVQSYFTGANYLKTTNHIQDGQLHQLMISMTMKSVRDLNNIVEISEGSLKTILKDHLGRRKVKSQLVPKSRNFAEKQRRVYVCQTILSDYQDTIKRIITGYKSWICSYYPETDDQSAEGEPKPKKSRRSKSKIKVFLTVFSIIEMWCTPNSFRPAKLSTGNTIWVLCVFCAKLVTKRDRYYGPTTLGFRTTIMHRHIVVC